MIAQRGSEWVTRDGGRTIDLMIDWRVEQGFVWEPHENEEWINWIHPRYRDLFVRQWHEVHRRGLSLRSVAQRVTFPELEGEYNVFVSAKPIIIGGQFEGLRGRSFAHPIETRPQRHDSTPDTPQEEPPDEPDKTDER